MSQTISQMSPLTQERLDEQREWVYKSFSIDDKTNQPPSSVEGKIDLIQAIIDGGFLSKNETYELQCLGIILGDVLVQMLPFSWVEVHDEYGDDPAVASKSHDRVFFPLTMISKRVEHDEPVDVRALIEFVKMHSGTLPENI